MTEQDAMLFVWAYILSLPGIIVYNSFVLYNVYTGKWQANTELMAGVCLSLLPLVGTFFAVGAVVKFLLEHTAAKGLVERTKLHTKIGQERLAAQENKHEH